MKKEEINKNNPTIKELFDSRSSKAGVFSLIAILILLAVIIVLNLIITKIPEKYTQFDLSSTDNFTIGEQSKSVINNLDCDINIYYICDSQTRDPYVVSILDSYESESTHLKTQEIDPIKNPKFASQFVDVDADSGSIIVTDGKRSKLIFPDDLYEYSIDYQSYSYQQTGFSAENMITNAIGYVTSEHIPTISFISGHGEIDLDSKFNSSLSNANYEIENLSLTSAGEISSDKDCIAIMSPSSDITDKDKEIIENYINNGGTLMLTTDGIDIEKQPNICKMLADWGIEPVEGTIFELDGDHFYSYMGQNTNYYLLPIIEKHDITAPLSNYNVIMAMCQGFNISNEINDNITVSPLLKTTDKAYSAIDVENKTTSEKSDGDIETNDGFVLAAAITCGKGKIVYYSNAGFLDASADQMVSGANSMLFINSFGWLCNKESALSIPAKSLMPDSLIISSSICRIIEFVLIIGIPSIIIIAGITVIIRRKKR